MAKVAMLSDDDDDDTGDVNTRRRKTSSHATVRFVATGDRIIAAAAGIREGAGRAAAVTVQKVIVHTRRVGVDARGAAKQILVDRGPTGGSGAFGQAAGHTFERLDVAAYNFLHLPSGQRIQLATSPRHGVYDGIRVMKGRPCGGIQHKLSASGIRRAIAKMEAKTPGSANRATLRLPRDRAATAFRAAEGRTRVAASRVSSEQVAATVEKGAQRLSRLGADGAISLGRAAGRAAGAAMLTGVALGSAVDIRRLTCGDLTTRNFVLNRVEDAADAGTAAVCALLVTAGLTATGLAIAWPLAATVSGSGSAIAAGTAARRAVKVGRKHFPSA